MKMKRAFGQPVVRAAVDATQVRAAVDAATEANTNAQTAITEAAQANSAVQAVDNKIEQEKFHYRNFSDENQPHFKVYQHLTPTPYGLVSRPDGRTEDHVTAQFIEVAYAADGALANGETRWVVDTEQGFGGFIVFESVIKNYDIDHFTVVHFRDDELVGFLKDPPEEPEKLPDGSALIPFRTMYLPPMAPGTQQYPRSHRCLMHEVQRQFGPTREVAKMPLQRGVHYTIGETIDGVFRETKEIDGEQYQVFTLNNNAAFYGYLGHVYVTHIY